MRRTPNLLAGILVFIGNFKLRVMNKRFFNGVALLVPYVVCDERVFHCYD